MLYNNMWLHNELVQLANEVLDLDEDTAICCVVDLAQALESMNETHEEVITVEKIAYERVAVDTGYTDY